MHRYTHIHAPVHKQTHTQTYIYTQIHTPAHTHKQTDVADIDICVCVFCVYTVWQPLQALQQHNRVDCEGCCAAVTDHIKSWLLIQSFGQVQ